eukprot:CAMPEP_0185747402 /NCGR_PEP_ID=MMETSP1174-20130828/6016_1 /TAXON_ID=35687 /ORGANISM="Dictyocha speculum, Strain CCMP1381" /LENGTH=56 /DNA_ID=CAMNT_0028422553 /DNA_START=113 /DNA_END=283 /DNA_ORIENTATION=+
MITSTVSANKAPLIMKRKCSVHEGMTRAFMKRSTDNAKPTTTLTQETESMIRSFKI